MVLNTCKEDAPTEPEGSKANDNVLASSTIGPSGGELKTDDFSLTIPAGSFQSETTLSLSTVNDLDYLGENSVSETFIIQDFPIDFELSIRIAMKYNSVLSDSSFIIIASTTEESFLVDSVYLYDLLSITDSSGFLVAEFDNSILPNVLNKYGNISANRRLEKITISGEAITGMTDYQSDYFNIIFPKAIGNDGVDFAEHMDNIFELFLKDFKFDFKYNNSFDSFNTVNYSLITPFRFHVFNNNKTGIIAQLSPRMHSRNADLKFFAGGYETLPSAKDKASLSMAFNLRNILIKTYNYNQEDSKVILSNGLLWWFEDYLGMSVNNQPPVTLGGSELSLFDGFVHQTISPGLSSLIKYLVDFQNYDVSNFGQIFENAHDNNKNHYVSLISHVDSLVMTWFPDYYEKYIKGEIYNIEGSVFANQPGDFLQTWTIDKATDTLKTFTADYNDLSAKRFFIELNHEFDDESANLVLETSTGLNSDGTAMIVFSVDANDNLKHLDTKRAEPIKLQNLKEYYQNDTKKFLVVVVNCINNGVDYTGVTEIDLNTRIKSKNEPEPVVIEGNYRCFITSHALHDLIMEKTGSDGSYESETYTSIDVGFDATSYGDINNYSFIGYYEDSVTTTSVDIRFDNEYESIESISVIHSIENNNEVGNYYHSFDAVNVPEVEWSDDIDCSIIGSNYCNSLQMSDYTWSVTYSNGGVTYTKVTTTTGFRCNDMSGINVYFYKQ